MKKEKIAYYLINKIRNCTHINCNINCNIKWLDPWAYEEPLPFKMWLFSTEHDSSGKFWRVLGWEINKNN